MDDAKTGVINTIIVKDLSRFGRNYIEVGQYVDYVFPAFGIRFIAIQDNVDTENRDSGAMEMMPIMNVFNEWHAANTSKKIRAVRRSNAKEGMKEGIYTAKKASYGYKMGTDKKRAPVIDEETAPIVKRIFEMYASGMSPRKISEILNLEGIPSPATYAYTQSGQKPKPNVMGLWTAVTIREMLNKIIYIGHMPQLRWTSLSYKNHKRFRKDESEWTVGDSEKMKASGLSFITTTNPSSRRNFGTKYKNAKSLLRKAEKQRSVTHIRCLDFFSAPIVETR